MDRPQISGNNLQTNLVDEAAEGNHGKAAVLDLGELVALEVLLVGALSQLKCEMSGFLSRT